MFVLSACSLKDTADQMKDTSDQIKDESKHLSKRTDDLEAQLVKKESFAQVIEKLQMLFGEAPMANSREARMNPESDMLDYAGFIVEAMHFQFWKGDYNEDINELDLRFKLSAEVLLVKCLKHIPRDFAVDVMMPNRSYKAIASLGAKLDRMTDRYGAVLKARNMPTLSLYQVVIDALRNRKSVERRELLPKASAVILQYRPEAIYMLQLRHNYIPMMVLGRMTDIQDRGNGGRLLMRLGWTSAVKIDLNKAEVGPEELKEWTAWLQAAADTRRDLRAMGITPLYNSMFTGIESQIDFGQKALLALPPSGQSELVKLQVAFARAYTAVVAESQTPVVYEPSPELPLAAPVKPEWMTWE
jgi:hypothetical protein